MCIVPWVSIRIRRVSVDVRIAENRQAIPGAWLTWVTSHSPLYSFRKSGDHQFMTASDHTRTTAEQHLDLIHWHMIRGDGLRSSLANRAGSLLSTDALIVAGVALAVGLGNQHPRLAVLVTSLATLLCVAGSVINASLVLITVRRWHQQFRDSDVPSPFLYSYTEMRGNFADFRSRVLSESSEQLLEHALVELWRCGRLHNTGTASYATRPDGS